MKKLLAILLTATLAYGLVACAAQPAASAPATPAPAEAADAGGEIGSHEWRLESTTNPGTALWEGVEHFVHAVEEKSEGKIIITPYYSSELGNVYEGCQSVMDGDIDFGAVSCEALATYWPSFDIMNCLFLFTDYQQAYDILDGEIGAALWAQMDADGIHALSNKTCFNGCSFRTISANKEIRTPDDLKGVKLRIMENPTLLAGWKATGANATPVAFTELYTALQQGTVDAQENAYDTTYSGKFYEINKYIINTNHSLQPSMLSVNLDLWNSLTDAERALIEEAATEAAEYQREVNEELTEKFKAEMEAAGVTFVDLTNEELKAFQDTQLDVYKSIADQYGDIALNFFDAVGVSF